MICSRAVKGVTSFTAKPAMTRSTERLVQTNCMAATATTLFMAEPRRFARRRRGRRRLEGGADGDLLFGSEGDDLLLGQDGDDTIEGGDGANSLLGARQRSIGGAVGMMWSRAGRVLTTSMEVMATTTCRAEPEATH